MPTIFISYRREDAEDPAGRLYDSLKPRFGEENVFMDVDRIPAGVDFVEAIENAVARCDVLLAVIGTRWLTVTDASGRRRLNRQGDFVRLELSAALKRGVRVVPVLVQGATMPRAEDLPRPLRRLAVLNAVSLRHVSWGQDLAHLCQELEAASNAQAPARPVETSAGELALPQLVAGPIARAVGIAQPSGPPRRRWPGIVTSASGAIAAIGAVAISAAVFLLPGRSDPGGSPPDPPTATTAPVAGMTMTVSPLLATASPTEAPTVALPSAASPEPVASPEPEASPTAPPAEAPTPTTEPPPAVPTFTATVAVTGPLSPPTATPFSAPPTPVPAPPTQTPSTSKPEVAVPATPAPTPVPAVTPPTTMPPATPTPLPPAPTATATVMACSPAPTTLFLRDKGFERLWNREASVRASIGCPTGGESYARDARFQQYRNGALLFWGSDSEQTVYALIEGQVMEWRRYDATRLPDLSVSPCVEPRVTPTLGFGKLLATYPDIARKLTDDGCAESPEQTITTVAREPFQRGSMLFVAVYGDAPGNPLWVLLGLTQAPNSPSNGSLTRHTADPP